MTTKSINSVSIDFSKLENGTLNIDFAPKHKFNSKEFSKLARETLNSSFLKQHKLDANNVVFKRVKPIGDDVDNVNSGDRVIVYKVGDVNVVSKRTGLKMGKAETAIAEGIVVENKNGKYIVCAAIQNLPNELTITNLLSNEKNNDKGLLYKIRKRVGNSDSQKESIYAKVVE